MKGKKQLATKEITILKVSTSGNTILTKGEGTYKYGIFSWNSSRKRWKFCNAFSGLKSALSNWEYWKEE